MFNFKHFCCFLSASVAAYPLVSLLPLEGEKLTLSSLGTAAIASQPQRVQWAPEKGRGSAGGTLSGGRRGAEGSCTALPGQTATTVTLLVPDEQTGLLTVSEQPTFSWYVETPAPVTMTFVLQDPAVAEPMVTKTVQTAGSGLVSLSPLEGKSLKVGSRYRWMVFVPCAGGQLGEVNARSFIERLDQPTLKQVAQGRSAIEQAVTYAKAGIWYDAIALLVQEYRNNPKNSTIKSELKSLLQQAAQPQSKNQLERVASKL